jgi:hypothetical protein
MIMMTVSHGAWIPIPKMKLPRTAITVLEFGTLTTVTMALVTFRRINEQHIR